jgi:SAM-dependent methyltransferase
MLVPVRGCEDRISVIKNHLPGQSRNILDVGSNAGYYLFELAKLGYLCHGLEADPDLVHYTALAAYLQNTKGVSCEWGRLDLSYIERMPCYDVILCLSVMHHIILAEGMDFAKAIGQGLARKAKHVMFFEMGQSNEIEADWSVRLPRMEPDPETWISQWLKQCGFRRVEVIGTSPTTVPRLLFSAYP